LSLFFRHHDGQKDRRQTRTLVNHVIVMLFALITMTRRMLVWLLLCLLLLSSILAATEQNVFLQQYDDIGANVEPHPDPNDEDYEGMVYVGRHDEMGHRMGFEQDNGIKYIFGTSFDESHKSIEEKDLHHDDLADRAHGHKTREQVLKERRHKNVSMEGPKPYGHVDTHALDGGVTPPKVVHVEPFFMDTTLVTNKQFAKFVKATYYESEAEKYGWSFVLASFVPNAQVLQESEIDPQAEHWVAVEGAYWRRPEGRDSSYKYREHHPVTQVSHRDAAEYCQWVGKRLPGEWEWEAAARANQYGPSNRTLYQWGEQDTWETAKQYANLWGNGTFPWQNLAEDGWRGTSPVKTFPPNSLGFYDMTGNVWEWMRGGKHKARIVRGGSYVDSLNGSFNHAATLGARATLHGTTTTGNVGFRCAKSPKRRVEHHYTWHDEQEQGVLGVEDRFGRRDMIPQRGWEDRFNPNDEDELPQVDDDQVLEKERRKVKRKVIKKRERLSTEL